MKRLPRKPRRMRHFLMDVRPERMDKTETVLRSSSTSAEGGERLFQGC
jgi:hypothetical protein